MKFIRVEMMLWFINLQTSIQGADMRYGVVIGGRWVK